MTINIKKMATLSPEEITFIYSMMVKYGGMPMHIEVEEEYQPPKQNKKNRQNRQNRQNRKSVKSKQGKSFPIDKTKPDLYNLKDPKWDKCTDEMFLTYKAIIESTE